VAELPGMITSLEKALEGDDVETIRVCAHTLKGAASNIGAPALLALAREIEDLAVEGESLAPIFKRLKDHAQLFLEEAQG
jgi:HPt (histidine-containing phosphotransfer) domain-containing protein